MAQDSTSAVRHCREPTEHNEFQPPYEEITLPVDDDVSLYDEIQDVPQNSRISHMDNPAFIMDPNDLQSEYLHVLGRGDAIRTGNSAWSAECSS